MTQLFSIYATFVIEERFGFNKTTLKTYLSDMAKGLLLAILLGGPLLAGILAFFEYAGDRGFRFTSHRPRCLRIFLLALE